MCCARLSVRWPCIWIRVSTWVRLFRIESRSTAANWNPVMPCSLNAAFKVNRVTIRIRGSHLDTRIQMAAVCRLSYPISSAADVAHAESSASHATMGVLQSATVRCCSGLLIAVYGTRARERACRVLPMWRTFISTQHLQMSALPQTASYRWEMYRAQRNF